VPTSSRYHPSFRAALFHNPWWNATADQYSTSFYPETAGRTLEDIDHYYQENPPLLVFRDKDVISSKRPAKYAEREQEEVRRNSSIDPAMLRRGSRVRSLRENSYGGNTITEKGEGDYQELRHKEAEV
jgi:hypothetical protein